ncbi:MAG TPA: hypothetical protein VN843_30845 [Anaerolineales bacterium]|nr:hypothetical protein [Anaerolineales bacterium]
MYRINKSETHGKGVFATKDIARGIFIGITLVKMGKTGDDDQGPVKTQAF